MPTHKLRALRWLTTRVGNDELEKLAHKQPIQASEIINLRRRWGNDRAAVLVECASVLKSAREKLGSECVLANDRALQQATHWQIAAYKAKHYQAGSPIADVCCGIGGDAIALAGRGKLIAIDRDPTMCIMAAHNLSNAAGLNSAVTGQTAGDWMHALGDRAADIWLHIDPDRRPQGKRVSAPDFCDPPADHIANWMRASRGGAIKLAPAASLPEPWTGVKCREWISHMGVCRQQVAWFDNTQKQTGLTTTKATMIDRDGLAHSFTIPHSPSSDDATITLADQPLSYLFDIDPAVRAAGLSAALSKTLGLACIDGPAGFFTSEQPPSQQLPSQYLHNHKSSSGPFEQANLTSLALLSTFKVFWRGKFDLKKLRREIEQCSPTSLEIKVRGISLKPENIRPQLLPKKRKSNRPNQEITLLLGTKFAALAHRL